VLYQNIVNRCNNIGKHTKIQGTREKKSLSTYWEMKKELEREFYTSCYYANERNATAWFRI